jgi:peroxiredoxin
LAVAATAFSAAADATPSAILEPRTSGPTPAFILDALDGGETRLSNYRGGVLLVHFFATWCAPCRTELRALARFAARRARQGPKVVAIAVGEVEPAVRRFLGAGPLAFRVLLDRDRAVAKAWDIYALPTTVLLDAALEPLRVAVGDVEWDDPAIDRLFDQLSPTSPAARSIDGRPPHVSRSRLLQPPAAQSGRTP